MEILWKGTFSGEFRAIRPKLFGHCAFPQNFRTRKLGGSTVFYSVISREIYSRGFHILSKYMTVLEVVGKMIFNVSMPENIRLVLQGINELPRKSERKGYPPNRTLLNKIPKLCFLSIK